MVDNVDESVSLQERELMRAISRATGRRPRTIEIPPPSYDGQRDGHRAEEEGKK